MDEESADVVFEVISENATRNDTTFYAHRLILQDCAPYLHSLCTSGDGGSTINSITDVKPEIFHHMLYYADGGKVPEDDLKANATEIILAADKYEIVGLKLESEAVCLHNNYHS